MVNGNLLWSFVRTINIKFNWQSLASFPLHRVVVWFLIATLTVGCFMSNVGKWRRVTKLIMNECGVVQRACNEIVILRRSRVYVGGNASTGFRVWLNDCVSLWGEEKSRHGETLFVWTCRGTSSLYKLKFMYTSARNCHGTHFILNSQYLIKNKYQNCINFVNVCFYNYNISILYGLFFVMKY